MCGGVGAEGFRVWEGAQGGGRVLGGGEGLQLGVWALGGARDEEFGVQAAPGLGPEDSPQPSLHQQQLQGERSQCLSLLTAAPGPGERPTASLHAPTCSPPPYLSPLQALVAVHVCGPL